jgi:hypothetical protein
VRESIEYRDEIYLGGFGERCHASRARRSSLIVPGGLPVTERVEAVNRTAHCGKRLGYLKFLKGLLCCAKWR